MSFKQTGDVTVPALAGLSKATSNLLEFFTWESTHCLSAHTSLRNRTQDKASRSLIIGSFRDYNVIILSHDEIETNKFASNLLCCIVKRSQTFGGIFKVL